MMRVGRRARTSPGRATAEPVQVVKSALLGAQPTNSGRGQPWTQPKGSAAPGTQALPRRQESLPAGGLQDPRLSIKGACLGSSPGTYPGAVACSPAHLAGWGRLRGPEAAALETGKPQRSHWGLLLAGS